MISRAHFGMSAIEERVIVSGEAFDAALKCARLYHEADDWRAKARIERAVWYEAMRAALAAHDGK